MINMGVIGYGYWGPNLVRNFSEVQDSSVVMVADLFPENLVRVNRRYPSIQTTNNAEDIFKNPKVDAVAISTPVSTHYDLCLKALRAGKHVFLEKPMVSSTDQGLALCQEADKRKLILFVDHTFLYTAAVRKIKEVVKDGRLGNIYYYDSVRINLGLFQHDVNVLWDLAVHDLSIMDYVLEQKPVAISATGLSHIPKEPENIAYLTCFFEKDLMAHIHVNWLAPVKIRKTLIGGDKKMVVYDDLEAAEKVKIYDHGIFVNDKPEGIYNLLVGYRTGDIWAPHLDTTEALCREASSFIECVQKNLRSISDGRAGLRIVHLLETASLSMSQKGKTIPLDWKKYDL